jgi:hypothetical protein
MNNKGKLLASIPIATDVALFLCLAPWATPQTTGAGQTKAVVAATTEFLGSLTADQRQRVQFPFVQTKATVARFARGGGPGAGPGGGRRSGEPPDGADKQFGRGPGDGRGRGGPGGGPGGGFTGEQYGQAVWSNFPVSDLPRPGLQLGSLSDTQRAAAMHLLQVLLSSKGYQKVVDIMGADQVLADGGTHPCE